MTLDETVRYVMETEWLEFDVRWIFHCHIKCNRKYKCDECRLRGNKDVSCLRYNYLSLQMYKHLRNNYPEELV